MPISLGLPKVGDITKIDDINIPYLRGINNSLYRGTKAPVLYSYNEGKVNLVRIT